MSAWTRGMDLPGLRQLSPAPRGCAPRSQARELARQESCRGPTRANEPIAISLQSGAARDIIHERLARLR